MASYRRLVSLCFLTLIALILLLNYSAVKLQISFLNEQFGDVHIIDLTETTNISFRCQRTKKILKNISATVCLYKDGEDRSISETYRKNESIWEEAYVQRLLEYLILHSELNFIDIGANIGTYTLFAATMNRLVMSIDCFKSNMILLRHALQLTRLTDRVILVNNAIYSDSRKMLPLSINRRNIGAQGLYLNQIFNSTKRKLDILPKKNPYVVSTIRFDELLPILLHYGLRSAIMKIDIVGSEHFVFQTGEAIFHHLNIPLIQIEWTEVIRHEIRANIIIGFLIKRNYSPYSDNCQPLDIFNFRNWSNIVYWLNTVALDFCSLFSVYRNDTLFPPKEN